MKRTESTVFLGLVKKRQPVQARSGQVSCLGYLHELEKYGVFR